jgi:hypothetical protein
MNTAPQQGQALAEYLLCTSVLVSALLMPWWGGEPVVTQWVQVLREWVQSVVWLLALS